MSHRDVRIPFANAPKQTCRWCGEKITHGRRDRRWHDGRKDEPRCVQEYRLVSDHNVVRATAKAEGWHYCVECGRPAPSLSTSRPRALDYEYRHPPVYSLPSHEIDRALTMALTGRMWVRMSWRDETTLEVDHRLPLIDGGAHSVDNLQLLCIEHHKAKTAREARERAARRRELAAAA